MTILWRVFVVAAVSAGFTACGGSPCKQMCSKIEECYKADFEDEYSDMDDCVEECEDDVDDLADGDDGCQDAIDALNSCIGDLECSDLADGDECENEQEDLFDDCDFEDMEVDVEDGGDQGNTATCDFQNDGECDEPEGTGACAEGTDTVDCGG